MMAYMFDQIERRFGQIFTHSGLIGHANSGVSARTFAIRKFAFSLKHLQTWIMAWLM